MAKKKKVSIKTAAQLRKECQDYLKESFRDVQDDCQEALTAVKKHMKKNQDAVKKLQMTIKGAEQKLTAAKKALAKKATQAMRNKVKTLTSQIQKATREMKLHEGEFNKLNTEMESIVTFSVKEKARATAAMTAFDKTYKAPVKPAKKKAEVKKTAKPIAKKAETVKKEKPVAKPKEITTPEVEEEEEDFFSIEARLSKPIDANKVVLLASAHAKPPLKAGDKAPDFKVLGDYNKPISLSDFRGKTVVLYFYPKDDTPGCTQQAKDFTTNMEKFKSNNVIVLGVSRDNVSSHCNFKEKYNIGYALLADTNGEVSERYGVIKNKNMYGKQVRGVERTTFVIDGNGTIQNVWRGVKVPGHIDEVIAVIEKKVF